MKTMVQTNKTIDAKKLARALAPVIRKIVREELERVSAQKPGVFYLEPGAPLYQDMEQILRDARSGSIRLLSREEALRD